MSLRCVHDFQSVGFFVGWFSCCSLVSCFYVDCTRNKTWSCPTCSRTVHSVQAINKSCPRLGSFLKDFCKDNLGNTGTGLFGVEVHKKITERATTINNFNKAIATVVGQGSFKSSGYHFLSKRMRALRLACETYIVGCISQQAISVQMVGGPWPPGPSPPRSYTYDQ